MPTATTTSRDGRLDLLPTIQLHDWLCEHAQTDPARFASLTDQIRQAVHQRSIWFERKRELPLALSAIMLRSADVQRLSRLSEQLHRLIERAIDWTLDDPQRLAEHFPDHVRMAPFFQRTPGLDSWQGYSRYDAVLTTNGTVKFIEVNTCCPAGFLHAPDASEITLSAFQELDLPWPTSPLQIGTLERGVLVDELLRIEQRGGGNPRQAVALLNDENALSNEVDMLRTAFRDRGREVLVANAAELELVEGSVCWRGRPISLTWNKIRVSTPYSPNHCWKPGFEQRYTHFLSGLSDQAMVSVNNLVAATVAEDKGLLALFHRPEFRSQLDDRERQFIDTHVLWTARLKPGPVTYRGQTIDLLDYVQKHRHRFVIKPANEGRGFGVCVGKSCEPQAWLEACQPPAELPCIVQEYAPPITLPILSPSPVAECDASAGNGAAASRLQPRPMQLTLAMGVICGKYRGLFSRVAAGPVTNVGQAGMLQAVFINDDD